MQNFEVPLFSHPYQKKRLETEIDRIRGEIKKQDEKMEQMEQSLRLLRDEIEETDETIFSMQKEREEKERMKQVILAQKVEEEKEEERRQLLEEGDEEESDLSDSEYEGTVEDVKHEDKMRYKILLRDFLKQKNDEIA